jgi:hypothetical protein
MMRISPRPAFFRCSDNFQFGPQAPAAFIAWKMLTKSVGFAQFNNDAPAFAQRRRDSALHHRTAEDAARKQMIDGLRSADFGITPVRAEIPWFRSR